MTCLSQSKVPLSTDPSHIGGVSRKWGDASPLTKMLVVSEIENKAAEYGLSQLDIANLLAIARVESGFNPDAATTSPVSSAAGVFAITNETAQDALDRLDGKSRINGHVLGNYDAFDLKSNIEFGIAIYLDKKARAHSNDVGDIYIKWNTKPEEYNKYLTQLRTMSAKYLQGLNNGANEIELASYFPSGGPRPRVCTPADTDGNGIPDNIDDFKNKINKAEQIVSPLILDLNGDGIATTAVGNGAWFDHDANGFAEATGWVNPDDGLLVRDLDGNGTIDTGRELFGSETILANGNKAANGYAALAELDDNHDGQIDAQDAAYSTIKIWQDIDGDGYSSDGELMTLAEAGVHSIATGHSAVSQTDANGNTVKQTGSFTRMDGTTGASADIWFQTDKTYTIANDWMPETDVVGVNSDLMVGSVAANDEMYGMGRVGCVRCESSWFELLKGEMKCGNMR